MHDWFASFDPLSSSWKTSQRSLVEDLERFSETWPRSGMMLGGTAYQLPPLAPHTAATGSGLLPTPEASNTKAMLPLFAVALLAAVSAGLLSPARNRDIFVPLVAIVINFFLVGIAGFTQLAILVGIVGGLSSIYIFYGYSHSKLAITGRTQPAPTN